MRTDRMRAAMLMVIASLWSARAAAQSVVEARSTTAVIGRPALVDGELASIVPIYEIVWVRGRQERSALARDVEAVVSGWGAVEPTSPLDEELVSADLDLAYLSGEIWRGRLTARLGRQNIVGGAARFLQLDGGRADLTLSEPVGLTVYGGAPVTPRFATDRGDAAAGGRLFWHQDWRSEIGASFVQILDNGRTSRQDIGFDARYSLASTFAISSLANISTWEQRLAEASIAASWLPTTAFAVRGDASRVAPDLLLSRASVLSVFASESRDEAGAAVTLAPRRWLQLDGDGHVLERDGEIGQRSGLGVAVFQPTQRQTRAGVRAERLELAEDGYWRARLTLGRAWRGARFFTGVELDGILLDTRVLDTRESGAVAAHFGWNLAERWQLLLGALLASSTTFERRLEGSLRVVYTPDLIVVRGAQ